MPGDWARQEIVLPIAPKWDAAPIVLNVSNVRFAWFYYKLHVFSLPCTIRVMWEISPFTSGDEWYRVGVRLYHQSHLDKDTLSLISREQIEYHASKMGEEFYTHTPLDFNGCLTRLRVRAQQLEAYAIPSELSIYCVWQFGA